MLFGFMKIRKLFRTDLRLGRAAFLTNLEPDHSVLETDLELNRLAARAGLGSITLLYLCI